MILLSTLETVRLSLVVHVFIFLHILLLVFIKGRSCLIFPRGITRISVINTLGEIVVQQIHDSREVLSITIRAHDAAVLEFCI